MATAAQVAANRANARGSTGPTTPEGKAVARRNPLKTESDGHPEKGRAQRRPTTPQNEPKSDPIRGRALKPQPEPIPNPVNDLRESATRADTSPAPTPLPPIRTQSHAPSVVSRRPSASPGAPSKFSHAPASNLGSE